MRCSSAPDYKHSRIAVNSDRQGLANSPGHYILLEMRRILALGGLCVALFPALLADTAAADGKSEADRWRHRYCRFDRCAPGPRHPWSAAIGFGVAALTAGWIGRRTDPRAG